MVKPIDKITKPDLNQLATSNTGTTGRQSPMAGCADDDHQRYWAASPTERQQTLHEVCEYIDPHDPHAAFKKNLNSPGNILDFGFGSGFTLLSIAKDSNWPIPLKFQPSFACSDCIQ